MAKKLRDTPEKERHLAMIIEDIDDKFQTILEATAPIPKMQEQIEHILAWEEDIKLIPVIVKEARSSRRR